MSSNTSYQKGIELAKQATQKDKDKEYEEAKRLYEQACSYFMLFMKYDKNPRSKDMLKDKVVAYLDRAEYLQNFLKEQEEKKHKPKQAAAEGGGDGDEDADTKALRTTLNSVVVTEKPDVHWDDVAGLEQAKQSLQEAVILPMRMPHLFVGKRKPWTGILLFGPPGTGKSYLAKAVATEADGSTFMAVSSSDLVSKWQGQSEKLVRELFRMARESAPTIVFVDEVDSMCGARGEGESESSRRIKTEFLVQMDGVTPQQARLLVLGATNIPWSLDSAIRRRFEKKIYIPLPDARARSSMFKLHLGKTPCSLTEADFLELGKESHMRSGADIKILVKDAIMAPVRKLQTATHFMECMAPDRDDPEKERKYWTPCSPGARGAVAKSWMDFKDPMEILEPKVSMQDMLRSMTVSKATVSKEDLVELEKWATQFGQTG
eukprot:m.179961 g.179961  ORF g.179961 m.179961 type:complete len:433 (+) comp18402_c0_seq1:265-1563(+)